MKHRITQWAVAGFLVAAFWAVYAIAARPLTWNDPAMPWIELTCPIAILRSYPLSLPLVLVANTATYALVGTALELFRRKQTRAV